MIHEPKKIEWTRGKLQDAELLILEADKLLKAAETILKNNPLRPTSYAVHDLAIAAGDFRAAKLRFDGVIF